MKPKFKSFYPVIVIDDTTIQIGDEPSNAFEIYDPEQYIQKLIPLMNGENDLKEIFNLLNYPEMSIDDLSELLQSLDEIGLIEDSSDTSIYITEWQKTRYKNNLNYFNIFSRLNQSKESFQMKLIDTKVLVLGMGGLGSNLLMHLSGLGIGSIKFIDCDTVELKNLNRQVLYSEKNIGHRKTTIGYERLKEFNTSINYEAIDMKVTSYKDLETIISDNIDFVFCAADTPPMQINSWVNKVCMQKNIPFISGGVGLICGSFYSVIPGLSACLECYHSYINEKFSSTLDAYRKADADYNSAIMPNISLLASMITNEFLRIYLHIAEPISVGKKTIINFLSSEISNEVPWTKNSSCSVCSKDSRNKLNV